MRIDLNCDLGEGAGVDPDLMPHITSANIACGAHAGDEPTMRRTVALAVARGVAIGAHPGYEDREHFGRRELEMEPQAAAELVRTQVARLDRIAREFGVAVTHVKLHGALYNQVARDRDLAEAMLAMFGRSWPHLTVVALAGSLFERLARSRRVVPVVGEVFADRTYQDDGLLTPRSRPDALIEDEAAAVAQVLRMVERGVVRTVSGRELAIRAETVCVHGDGPKAVDFARELRRALAAAGISVQRFAP